MRQSNFLNLVVIHQSLETLPFQPENLLCIFCLWQYWKWVTKKYLKILVISPASMFSRTRTLSPKYRLRLLSCWSCFQSGIDRRELCGRFTCGRRASALWQTNIYYGDEDELFLINSLHPNEFFVTKYSSLANIRACLVMESLIEQWTGPSLLKFWCLKRVNEVIANFLAQVMKI